MARRAAAQSKLLEARWTGCCGPAPWRLLEPRPSPSSFGASVLANLKTAGMAVRLYLINPKRQQIRGGPVWLTSTRCLREWIAQFLQFHRPAFWKRWMRAAAAELAESSFSLPGLPKAERRGAAEQERLAEIAQAQGMIIEGPNCLGMVNFLDGIPLTFVLTPQAPFEGRR